jgi:hypothetical protein
MSQAALGRQFDPSTLGAEEARTHARGYTGPYVSPERRRDQGEQQRLFPVSGSDYMLEPHQQTRSQFANDPRTWWHGRYSEQLPRTGGQRNAGIHVGTFGSSDKRRRDLGPSRKSTKEGTPQEWRSFPVRLQGETANMPGEHGYDEGAKWSSKRGIHYYENQVEDAGSISALVPSRASLLTHSQSIKEAQQKGLYVHPHIEWESKQLGKEYDPTRRDPQARIHETLPWMRPGHAEQEHLFSPAPYNEGPYGKERRMRPVVEEAHKSIAAQQWAKNPVSKMSSEEHLEHLKATVPGLKEHLEKQGK